MALANLLKDKEFINCDLSEVRKIFISAKSEFATFAIQNPSSAGENKRIFEKILNLFSEIARL